MYEVIISFTDLLDGRHIYRVGDEYPRSGAKVGNDRINTLLSSNNKIGKPLIKQTASKTAHVPEAVAPTVEETVAKPKNVGKKRRSKDVAGEDT